MPLTPAAIAAVNAAASVAADPRGDTVVSIGGLQVRTRVKEDGRLRVWIEVGEDVDVQLIHPDTTSLPVEIGLFETCLYETDTRGLNEQSELVHRRWCQRACALTSAAEEVAHDVTAGRAGAARGTPDPSR